MLSLTSINLIFLLLIFYPVNIITAVPGAGLAEDVTSLTEPNCKALYTDCGLAGKLDYSVFRRAYLGIDDVCAPKTDIITIIDYTKPSCDNRFYVIDLVNRKLVYHTLVAHGKNSGELLCTRFSNTPASLQSSPGFFLTAETYLGRHGYSMRIDGVEPGINDQARARAIVIHGAEYVAQHYVDNVGYIGRSFGCPALPMELNKKIIDFIKGGSCIYVHTNDKKYDAMTSICD